MMFASAVIIFVWILCIRYSQGAVSTLCKNCSVTHGLLRGMWYSFHFESVDWFEGLQRCTTNNGTLAEIMETKTMNYLKTHLSREVPANVSGMWIGLRQSSPGIPSFVWQSGVHRYEESYCVTRGQGEVNCASNMRLTATECHNLGCCWKPLGQKCYIPNYVNACQGAQPGDVTACRIKLVGSRHDRKRSCLKAGCCWKDWPRLSPGDAHPPCFYMSNEVSELNFTKWVSKSPEMTERAVRKCVILSRQESWNWEVRDCQGGQGGLGFLCQYDDFSERTNETLKGTDPVSFDHLATPEVTSSTVHIKWLNFTTKSNITETAASVEHQTEFSTYEVTSAISENEIGYSVDLNDFNQTQVTPTASIVQVEKGFPVVSETHQVLIGSVMLVILLLIVFVFVALLWRKRQKMRSRGNSYSNHYSEPFDPPTTTGALFCVNPAYVHDINRGPIAYEELDFYMNRSLPPGPSDTRLSDTTDMKAAVDLQLPERSVPPMYEAPPTPRACVPLYLQPCQSPHTESHGYDLVPVPSATCENAPLYDIPNYVPRDT